MRFLLDLLDRFANWVFPPPQMHTADWLADVEADMEVWDHTSSDEEREWVFLTPEQWAEKKAQFASDPESPHSGVSEVKPDRVDAAVLASAAAVDPVGPLTEMIDGLVADYREFLNTQFRK